MDIETRLDDFADSHEIDYEEAKEQYDEQLEDVQERATDAISDEKIEQMAFTQFRAEFNKGQSVSEGDAETVDIIALGHGGIQEWNSGDTLLAYGIANPEDDPANKAVFIIDGEDAYLEDTKDKFEPFQALEGNFSVTVSSDVSDLYVCNSTSETEVMESEMDMSEEDRHEWVNENHVTDRATLDDVANHLSMTNDEGYTAEFGGDLKRMQATIVSWYIPDDWSFGVMTLQDESVVDPLEELDEEVIGDDADNTRTPGLTAWADPDIMEYGEYSVCDFYGTLSRDKNGQITFNTFGIRPIMPTELDASDIGGSGGDESVDTSAEETSI